MSCMVLQKLADRYSVERPEAIYQLVFPYMAGLCAELQEDLCLQRLSATPEVVGGLKLVLARVRLANVGHRCQPADGFEGGEKTVSLRVETHSGRQLTVIDVILLFLPLVIFKER